VIQRRVFFHGLPLLAWSSIPRENDLSNPARPLLRGHFSSVSTLFFTFSVFCHSSPLVFSLFSLSAASFFRPRLPLFHLNFFVRNFVLLVPLRGPSLCSRAYWPSSLHGVYFPCAHSLDPLPRAPSRSTPLATSIPCLLSLSRFFWLVDQCHAPFFRQFSPFPSRLCFDSFFEPLGHFLPPPPCEQSFSSCLWVLSPLPSFSGRLRFSLFFFHCSRPLFPVPASRIRPLTNSAVPASPFSGAAMHPAPTFFLSAPIVFFLVRFGPSRSRWP